ncbi:HK97 family phage prohead protease [Photobacterium carnosum]|uniref:HK97 family phage prohead protease n=1 Tax=Photobacterium carnosum TaxID=2023717 RepID=UPI001E37B35A|nr:hypothetical protein [Photobacterium carnosum]
MSNPKVEIDAFNPYEAKFPNRTVITREELHLIKVLRQQGFDYKIRSKYNEELYILSQKNFESLLVDPMFLTLFNIGTGLITALIYDLIKGKVEIKDKLFIKNKDGEVFNYEGQSLDKEVINNITNKMLTSQKEYKTTLLSHSPYANLPFPVHLEHTPKVIGWCNLFEDEVGLRVDPCKVTCPETWERIQSGDLKGMSIGGLISKSKCTVCGSDYRNCNHISGNKYDGIECINEIHKFDLAEVSIVKNPTNSLCNISLSQ